jgi:DMSO/TMAO reductase YedYZ molybdopterin-dependent catalytic subunit
MSGRFISRGFSGKRQPADEAERVPPGPYLTDGFPVLSAGPTPHIPLGSWTFTLEGLVKKKVS